MDYNWRQGLNALLIFGGMFALLGIIVCLRNLYEGSRSDRLKAIGQVLGYEFLPRHDAECERLLSQFALCSAGHSRTSRNLLLGTSGAADLILFDHQFVTGGGKNKSYSTQTVLWLRSPELKLPRFLLRPEHFGDVVHGWIGGQDFDFTSHPEFSRRFVLVGDDEASVRAAFTEPVLQRYQGMSGV